MKYKKKAKETVKRTEQKKTARIKALGLFSGGLDSILASRMMKELGFDVELLYFSSPFFNCCKVDGKSKNGNIKFSLEEAASQLGLKLSILPKGKDYLEVIKNARHGYGTGMNPCVDCRIYTFRKAWEYAKKIGAKFIFTGEVLGERPLSQTRQALDVIERYSKLDGKIVRPLSGRLLPATEAERKGWVKRNDLMAISGRGRQTQMQLADKWHLMYPSPGGGCLLTEKHYGLRLKDLLEHKKDLTDQDIATLSIGRHFRSGKGKIIVGRREDENKMLKKLKQDTELMLECEEGIMGPITLLQGDNSKIAIQLAAQLTAYFSDARQEKKKKVKVNVWDKGKDKCCQIIVSPKFNIEKEMKKGLIWIGQNQQA